MRKKRVILLCALMACVLSIMAQGSDDQRVTINLDRATLGEFLNEVKQQTGLDFIMASGSQSNARVTVHENNVPLRSVLTKVLGKAGFNYEIREGFIALSDKVKNGGKRTISGRIIDQSGDPLLGAVVSVKGHQIRTVTNSDGHYSIEIPTSECTLEFSFVGMKPEQRSIHKGTGLSTLNVAMNSSTELDEVVVTGYQELDRTRIAGSVSQVQAKDLDLTPISSIEQALQGKLAGVAIQNQSGLVGVKQKTRVRGTSTLLGSQEPVWVVDGVIQETPLPFDATEFDTQGGITEDNFDYIRNFVGNSISWLNPMDIENITVLKDASATAIYGVRAANGVIVIKTKRGKTGSLAVSYSGGVNFGERVSYNALERMNSLQRVAVSKEIFERGLISLSSSGDIGYAGALNKYLFGKITADDFESQVAKMETRNTDWFDILFRNPVSHRHSLSFSGGSEKARYYSSLSYNKTNGTAIGNDNESFGAHVGLNMDFSRKFRVSADISGNYSTTEGFFAGVSPYTYAFNTNRAISAFEDDGSLSYYHKEGNGYLYNIINERDNTGNKNKNLTLTTSINAYYDILDDLRFNTLFSLNVSSVKGESWATEYSNYIAAKRFYEYGSVLPTSFDYLNSPLPRGGEYDTDNTNQFTWNWRNSLQYDKLFNNVHALTTMIGMEMSSTKYDGYRDVRYGYLPERGKAFAVVPTTRTNSYGTTYANVLLEQTQPKITDRLTNTMGLYLTLNYAYDNRYVVNFSVRGDASNRFGQYHNEKFNPVWAGGLRWNVAREKWFENQSVFSDLSVRASFGYQRNMASNFSSALILRIPSQTGAKASIIDERTGNDLLNISNIPYDDLRWEKTFSQNYGADFGLFNNKIRMSVEYYYKKGTDIITTMALPREYGIENIPVNSGSMVNKGYELTVGFTPIRTKDFTWDVSVNTAKNWNEVTEVAMQSMSWKTAISGSFNKDGYPVTSLWAFKYEGIDPETGYPVIDTSYEPGADLTDPTSFMVHVGKLDPDFTGGLGMSFRYKQFSLSTSLYLQLGGKKFLSPAYQTSTMPSEYENLSTELLNRWTPENRNAEFPGLPDYNIVTWNTRNNWSLPNNETATKYEMYNYSTARVVSASSLRCNNMSLNYSFPNEWLKRTFHLQSMSIGASVSNIFAINSKDFKGRDAEVATGQQPRTRSCSFNLNVAF
ncbi:MAG: SusC/RagA family TonB-linked outer membrane protein [Prevotella sp.]|nr:SusC/RagA family TonB-linked outer membrane protein [Prevotella sp.]MBR1463392.1 SusC/RagA family TonB-linked outer membrane protein [Prevotella sp.]